ncbi:NUDIX domain-containing protein [Streptomyces narbonensis]
MVREAHEEAGLVIDPADLGTRPHRACRRPARGPTSYRFLLSPPLEGTPEVREPDKCVAWQWWSAKDLPEPIVPYTRAAVEGILAGRPYTEMGWSR